MLSLKLGEKLLDASLSFGWWELVGQADFDGGHANVSLFWPAKRWIGLLRFLTHSEKRRRRFALPAHSI